MWDAVVAGHCPRCSGPHLRVACPKPRQGWEDDFEKEDFFTKPPPPVKKQLRVQMVTDSSLPSPAILAVLCPFGRCLIDTCSDVSVARRDVITGIHNVEHPVLVEHWGGETCLQEAGTLEMRSFSGAAPTFLHDVHVIAPEMLPAGVVALLGVADIRALNLSLDAILDNPDCPSGRLSDWCNPPPCPSARRTPAPKRRGRIVPPPAKCIEAGTATMLMTGSVNTATTSPS